MAATVGMLPIPIPALPPRSTARTYHPSPFKVLYLTNQKLERELAASVPNLRRLVLCANTYDHTLAHQASIKRKSHQPESPPSDLTIVFVNSPNEKKSSATKHRRSKTTIKTMPETNNECDDNILGRSEIPTTIEVVEIDACDFEPDFEDATANDDGDMTGHAQPGITEDLFDDWEAIDSSENESEEDSSDESASSEDNGDD